MPETKIMIIAGEASGDLHGSRLVRCIKELKPDASFYGIGGDNLKAEGVDILYESAKIAVVGFTEVLSHFFDIRAAMKALEERMKKDEPQLLILIDFPDFNLIMAGKAKRLGIPIFYYISPQVWAWRSGRVKKIGRLVDRMAVILPFEKEFYHERGVEVEFAGHPLMDSVTTSSSKKDFRAKHDIPENSSVIGLLPGSRKREISSILPIFLEAAEKIGKKINNVVFLLPLAPTLSLKNLEDSGLRESSQDIRVISDDRYDLMASCDAAMAASGTVTLELAILNIPMVVAYRTSPLTFFIGSRLIKVKYASLVNLVAEREVVPEFLQDNAIPENISNAVCRIMEESGYRMQMLDELTEVREKLGKPGASKRAAELALQTFRGN